MSEQVYDALNAIFANRWGFAASIAMQVFGAWYIVNWVVKHAWEGNR